MRISDWSSDVCSSDLLGRETLGKVPLSAVAMERKGTSNERGDEQRAVRARNQERSELTKQLRDISPRIGETKSTLGDNDRKRVVSGQCVSILGENGAHWFVEKIRNRVNSTKHSKG